VAHSKCAKWHIQNVLLREVAQNVLRMSSTPTHCCQISPFDWMYFWL